MTIVINEEEDETNEYGWAEAAGLLGTYPVRTTNENVALEGDMIIENKMADKIQPITANLKTVFSITVDKECDVTVKDSAGKEVCPGTKLNNLVFSCTTAEIFPSNSFDIEVYGFGVEAKTYEVIAKRTEDFAYSVSKEIVVEPAKPEYSANVTVRGIPDCDNAVITVTFSNEETGEKLPSTPEFITSCASIIKFKADVGTPVMVQAEALGYASKNNPTFVTGEDTQIDVSIELNSQRTLIVNLDVDSEKEGAEFKVSIFDEETG